MGKGGGSAPTSQTVVQTNLPEYAKPYFENLLERSQAQSYNQYLPYGYQYGADGSPEKVEGFNAQRIAGFDPQQIAAQQGVAGLQRPGQFGQATNFANQAGLGALSAGQYQPGQFNFQNVDPASLQQYQMGPASEVMGGQYSSPQMSAAQTSFNPALERFQMQAPDQFGRQQAQQYMSPYMQEVVDVQKQEAVRDAQKSNLAGNLGAARQGTYGGARQLLAQTERERALGRQLGDIQATGSQRAFEQAQQQFERDRTAGMTAQQRNLEAALGVQTLGTQTGLQTALSNLSADQQSRVQNMASQLQTQGLNADQALRAALANQQMGFNVGQQNLNAMLGVQQLGADQSLRAQLANQQYGIEAQRLGEQSRQFGSNLGLQGYQTALQGAQTLGTLGQTQQQSDLSRLQALAASGAEQRGYEQQLLDTRYADFLRQRDYPMEQLGYYSNMLRGLPVQLGSTSTTYAQPPSMTSQLGGAGLAALGMNRLIG
jgi:hypothetical protein